MRPPHRRQSFAAQRFADRRRREDEAPRLSDRAPGLASLRFDIADRHGPSGGADTQHTRIIVLDRAPALFVFPCGDRACNDGGHDLTDGVMRALAAARERFELTHVCDGTIADARCGRELHVVATATYHAAPPRVD
ncbi:MAG TPA: hypothetical protein VHB21_21800 [Minicystis sp.]|nr:hypothetical protein [Minicystis sp.]